MKARLDHIGSGNFVVSLGIIGHWEYIEYMFCVGNIGLSENRLPGYHPLVDRHHRSPIKMAIWKVYHGIPPIVSPVFTGSI